MPTLLKPNQTWAQVRILVRESFGSEGGSNANKSGGGWAKLPMQRPGQRKHGFEFLDCDRVCLPFVGRARFKLEYGLFADGLISPSAGSADSLSAGDPWDASQDQLDIQDLRGYEVRIQFSEDGTTWATGWWGQVEYQEDDGAPGASIPMGTRTYHCVDGLQRTARWNIKRHGYTHYTGSSQLIIGRGALGYNLPAEHDAIVSKNRSNDIFQETGQPEIHYHTAAGMGDAFWTAQDAAEHALAISRPLGEPAFTFFGATDLLAGIAPWQVKEGDTAFDVLNMICRRERGRGNVFVDWTEDDGPEGPLTVNLTVLPQLLADVTYTDPGTGDETTISGADTLETTVNPDLIGDHRNVANDFRLGDPYQFRFDYLETLGEPIEVLATLAYVDGQTGSAGQWEGAALAKGWSDAEATAFRALTGSNLKKRRALRYKPVFQLHALRPDWDGTAGDGNGGATLALQRIDYRCADDGTITSPAASDAVDTSPALIQLLSDLPMFDGWDYTNTAPAQYDTASKVIPASRRPLLTMVRKSDDRYLTHDQTGAHSAIAPDHNFIWIMHAEDQDDTTRYFSVLSDTTLEAGFDYKDIVLTVGIRLPHRARFASGETDEKKRRKSGQVIHNNMHLWLASPGAIWEIDAATGDDTAGFAAKRQAGNASDAEPGTLRDDRAQLAAIHALTWAWYGTDTDRRSATWSLNCCGFLGSFSAVAAVTDNPQAADATDIDYPALGELVNTLGANGEYHVINTPITRVHYDHKRGKTTWSSEWSELELER